MYSSNYHGTPGALICGDRPAFAVTDVFRIIRENHMGGLSAGERASRVVRAPWLSSAEQRPLTLRTRRDVVQRILSSISARHTAMRASGVGHTDRGALAMHAPYFELAWSRFFAHLRLS